MKYLVALYSIIGLVVYAGLLQLARSMSGFGDGAPQHFTIWTVSALFPFAYFLFVLGSCFIRRPGPVMIRSAVVMQIAMALYLLQMIFEGFAIGTVFVLGLFGLWLLMFLEKSGVIRLGYKDTFVGVCIAILMQISLTLLIFGITYLNMSLLGEGMVLMGAGLGLGMASYLWSMRFADRVRIESFGSCSADSKQQAG